MSLINKLFKGKNTENNAGTQAQQVPEASSQADADAGCTTTEESARIYAFAKANASQANTEKIFGTKEADSYYTDSARVQVFPENHGLRI